MAESRHGRHAESERICPGCGQLRTFLIRNKCHSVECARNLRYGKAPIAVDGTASAPTVVAPKGARESSEFAGNAWTISIPKTRIHTLEDLIAYYEIDLGIWEVERFVANKWEVGAKDDTGKIVVEPLFQIKAWLKRKANIAAARFEIESLKQAAKKSARQMPAIQRGIESGYCLEFSVPDLHAGKLAWANETGWEHYDLKIAQSVFNDAMEALVRRTSGYRFDEIVFVLGNDLLHSDNEKATTTHGTPLGGEGVDGRYQKVFVRVREMMTEHIERLRGIAPVKVIVVPGNHDQLSSWHLGDSLECYFANYADVKIDNEPKFRKYHRFGANMIMFTHGNRGKLHDYPLVMATEEPKMFGDTIHREAHTGDKHQLKVQELHGVRVRISPALCAADAWHSEHQFVGNARSAEAFVWHKDEGLVATATYTVPTARQYKESRRSA